MTTTNISAVLSAYTPRRVTPPPAPTADTTPDTSITASSGSDSSSTDSDQTDASSAATPVYTALASAAASTIRGTAIDIAT